MGKARFIVLLPIRNALIPNKAAVLSALLFSFALGCSSEPGEPAPQNFPAKAFATVTSDSGKLQGELRSIPQPLEQGPNEILLTIHDAETHEPKDGLTLTVEPWMPHHEHGSSVVPKVKAEGNGNYLVEDVVFTMPGDWDLRIHITSPVHDAFTPTVVIH